MDVTLLGSNGDRFVAKGNKLTGAILVEGILAGGATEVTTAGILTELQLKANLNETQPVSAVALPLPTGAATSDNQTTELTQIGSVTETAPGTDTANSGLNGRLQRIAQRITSLIALFPTALSNGFFQVSLKESIALILSTGSAIIGKVGIDQTTDGTTNLVVIKNRITTVSNGSGTITTGNTAQTAIASDAGGYNYLIQNNSNGDLWFSTLAAAIIGQPSIKLPPNAIYETPDSLKATGALSVIGATTGQEFTVRKW